MGQPFAVLVPYGFIVILFGDCMKKIIATALIAGALVSSAAFADPQVAKANKCFACHSLDKKIIGPSFRDMANKYAGQAGAEAKIADRTRRGSVGVWGTVPMQPMPEVSDADLKILAKWILAQ